MNGTCARICCSNRMNGTASYAHRIYTHINTHNHHNNKLMVKASNFANAIKIRILSPNSMYVINKAAKDWW